LNNILYIPTRYFPSISGAEFYFQRLAEIFNSKFNETYKVDIFTSNAIDFKALRDPKGKIIDINHKYFNIVNKLKINRFSINYTSSFKDKFKYIKDLKPYSLLDISDITDFEYLGFAKWKNGVHTVGLFNNFPIIKPIIRLKYGKNVAWIKSY